jgi:hypothetical protein
MSKNKRNRNTIPPQINSPQNGKSSDKETLTSMQPALKEMETKAADKASHEEIETKLSNVDTTKLDMEMLVNSFNTVKKAETIYEELKIKQNRMNDKLISVEESFQKKEKEQKERASALEKKEKQAEEERLIQIKKDKELTKREEEADRGFQSRQKEIDLENEAKAAEIKRLREECEKKEEEITLREQKTARLEKNIELEVKARIADQIIVFETERQAHIGQIERLRSEVDKLHRQLEECRDQLAKVNNCDIEQLRGRNQFLEERVEELSTRLSSRPEAEILNDLNAIKLENERLGTKNDQLFSENSQLQITLKNSRVGVVELDNCHFEINMLKTRCDLYKCAADELRKTYNEIVEKDKKSLVFPSCSEMDSNSDLQKASEFDEKMPALHNLVLSLRNEIAVNDKLYFSMEDMRCFVAGMAMSRLMIIQGISGTGKTSLPKAFSKAIGSDYSDKNLIPIQAGWRDRSDLIGHYNSFQEKYYESPFLQALYRTQMPRFKDMPYIIILDEMNLSHAEQYFADFISLLEQESNAQILKLMTFTPGTGSSMPKEFDTDGGVNFAIPENVWFIGTANHDETTMDFADKTYDRAHIMELPTRAIEFEVQNTNLKQIKMDDFIQSFEKAQKKHLRDANGAIEYLQNNLKKPLNESFGLNWGNRLEKQIKLFVPVIIAAGGTIGEAMDHIISTKILRKLLRRHDNKREDIEKVKNILQNEWLDNNIMPEKSLLYIERAMDNAQ